MSESIHQRGSKRGSRVALAVLASLLAQGALGADLDKRIEFNIPAQDLSAALIQFSQQSRLQVIIREDLTGQTTTGINGALPIKQALLRLLDPAGLRFQVVGDTSITVGKVTEKTSSVPQASLRLASAEETVPAPRDSTPPSTQSQSNEGSAIAEITVTGSRLAQADDSPLPVTTINIEDFKQGAQATPADFLQKLSVALSADGRGTWGFNGEGEAAIGMRGLEAKNTLFLVNGFRIAQDGVNGASNMNSIPAAAIERVEVLTGGASAIYGTDAVAGVINYILKKDFDGIAFDTFYGDSSRGGRETVSASFLAGTPIGDGRGNLMLGASYLDQKGITSLQRRDLFNGSRNVNSVRVPGSFTFPAGFFGAGSTPGRYTIRDGVTQPTGTGDFRLRNTATDTWNTATNQGFYVTFPLQQTSLFGSLEYELIEDTLTFFSDFSYTKTDTSDRYYAAALTVSNGARSVATINDGPPRIFNLRIPATNYYNQQLFGGNAVDILNWDLRFAELGYTERTLKRDEYRIVAGLRGRIGADYDWQVAFNRSEFNRDESQANQINLAALERALARTTPDAFNPFGPNSATVIDELRVTLPFDENSYEQSVIASVRGPIVELPAGRMTGAVGVERRRSYVDRPLGQATYDFRGSFPYDFLYDITGYFAEVNVPLFDSLTLDLAGRAEDYQDMFDTTVGSVSLRWRPIDSLLVRGSYSQGFVAPGVTDLASNGFTTPQQSFRDPRSGQSFALDIYSIGNRQLKPESSDIYNLDVTFRPDSVPGLMVSTGYFRIEQQDIVRDLSVQYIIDRYFATGGPGNAGAEFADRVQFDSAANRILQVTRGPFNLAERTVDGIDFSVQYRLPEFDIGTFTVGLNGSRYLTFEEVDMPGSDPVSYLGTVRDFMAVYPKLKASANVQWSLDRWSASLGTNGFSSVNNPGSTVKRRLGAYVSTDLSLSYQFDRVGVTTAVDNVFGREPPMDTSIYGNYPLNSYDPTGRYYSVRMSTKF
ncbi:TonB-dependent receptor [Peristeroidobacter soli]|uniref:TonB-dependent receptor n=1 Tax=Peristeroidobacter soli TaxID=2497877 RepID=UPI00101DC312|nr:TonB-dependent receptor [Peristeroidobacter soli]